MTAEDVLEYWFREYYNLVHHYIKERLRECSKEEIEDRTSEVFHRAFRRLHNGGEPIRYPKQWLIRIANGVCIDYSRMNTRKMETVSANYTTSEGEERSYLEDLACADEDLPEVVAEKKALVEKALRYLHELPSPLREAITLRYLREGGLEPIAMTLGKSRSTVQKSIREGLGQLRACLLHEEMEEVERTRTGYELAVRLDEVRDIYFPVIRYWKEGLPTKQIAQRLHYSEGTVRCYLSRARQEQASPPKRMRPGKPRKLVQWTDEQLAGVSEPARQVLVLYYREGWAREQIAQQYRVPIARVKALVRQGRRELYKAERPVQRGRGRPHDKLDATQQCYLKRPDDFICLPDIYKTVLLSYYCDRKSIKAIAADLNASVGTIKSRLARGRVLLKARAIVYEAQRDSEGGQWTDDASNEC